jgi:putative ABC transport system permease protein
MAMTDWRIVTRSLRARLFSTLVTVVTVALAVALMVALLMLRASGMRAFERGTGNVHLVVSRDASGLTSVLNGMFYAGAPPRPVLWAEYQKLVASLPLDWAVPVQLGDSYRGQWPVLATTPEFFTRFRPAEDTPWTFRQGRAFDADFQVVLGASAARATGLRLGDHLELTHGTASSRGQAVQGHVHADFEYSVVGILAPTGTAHDRAMFTTLQSAWIIHAADRIEKAAEQASNGAKPAAQSPAADDDHHHHIHVSADDLIDEDRKITNIYLRVLTRPGQDASAATPMVLERIRRDPAFQAAPLTVAGPVQEIRRLNTIVGGINQVLVAMAAAVMLSSGIGILLALYNSMEQRRRQIAILRVLGASRARIFGLILTESALIGLIGAATGLAAGLLGAQLAAGALRDRLGVVISPTISPDIAAAILLSTLALSLAAGLIPASIAYRTPVARHLKPTA